MTSSASPPCHRPFQGLRPARLALLAALALALAGCLAEPETDEAELELTASYKAQVKNHALVITGNNAASSLALRLGADAGILEVDVGDDGSADFRFDRATFDRIRIDAGGGNDLVRMDEQLGAFTHEEQVTMNGGSGNDTLIGGIGPETVSGGTGNDLVQGRYGADSIALGAGDDTYVWEPGGASDSLEGDDGLDTMVFNGSAADEQIALATEGDRVRLTRDVAAVTLDLHGIEVADLGTRGGTDRVAVGDLSGTALTEVNVDLVSSIQGQGDQAADTVVVSDRATADVIDVAGDGAAVTAALPYAHVSVASPEPALDRLILEGDSNDTVHINGSDGPDSMAIVADAGGALYDGGGFGVLVAPSAAIRVTVNGLGGDDHITTIGGVTTPLVVDGGDGDDQVEGGLAADVLGGGAGNDIVAGHGGDDTAHLGDGDDQYLWNPGDRSDLIEGEGGTDALVFDGSGANESIDLRASGDRLRLTRDVAAVTMDLGGIERVDVRTRGGSDRLVVGSLVGTAATEVNADLAPLDGTAGDGLADSVIVTGVTAGDIIDVRAEAGAVTATGIGARLSVAGGEPALDRLAVDGGLLRVHGTDAADAMVVYADAGGALYDGGGFDVLVAPGSVGETRVLAHGGDDSITTSGGVTVPLYLDGGDGDDHISGGFAADVLVGGAGNDVVDGQQGADAASLGDGDDIYLWDPGDSSDVVDGDLGADALVFNGSAVDEAIEIAASGTRAALTRSIAAVAMDLGGIERIDVAARGGADALVVGDLRGTPVSAVNLDLTGSPGGTSGDGLMDSIVVLGSPLDDAVVIAPAAAGVLVVGLAAAVQIAHPDPSDQLGVHGQGGTDSFAVDPAVTSLLTLSTYQD